MYLYIDPGTGSMLFAILIGIIGAVRYMLKGWFVKLRFRLSGGEKVETNADKLPLVIFSDNKRYWNIFDPVCRELSSRGLDTVYMTASKDDPALDVTLPHFKAEFIGENNKAFARLNFLNARMVLSTTPGLDVYQWKRSKDVDYYIHIPHAASDITMYHMFGIDYYDAIMVSGDYQEEDIRKLEALRHLPEKEVVKVGIPYMDEMRKRLCASELPDKKERTVLLAPSWGKASILNRYGGSIIRVLLETGYHVIVRPHPQSFISETAMIESLMKEYPASDWLEWNRDNDNFDVLNRSDILISDFSGVIFDFTLVYDKPVIYTEASMDLSPYDAWWLDQELWTFRILPKIGTQLNKDNMENLKSLIDTCLGDPRYAAGREEARRETWLNRDNGAKAAADYLVKTYQRLTEGKG